MDENLLYWYFINNTVSPRKNAEDHIHTLFILQIFHSKKNYPPIQYLLYKLQIQKQNYILAIQKSQISHNYHMSTRSHPHKLSPQVLYHHL